MVFWAEITITGRPGRCAPIFGNAFRPLPSGMTTSVMTRSPFPSSTQRISVAIEAVAWTLQPARVSACVRTVRIVRSSSATRTVPSIRQASFGFASARGATGRQTRNTVRPGTLSTAISPSWSVTILDTSASPSPVPFSRPETKGSKI